MKDICKKVHKRFSRQYSEHVSSRTKEMEKSLYIYDIHDVDSSSLKKTLDDTHNEIKINRCITVSPTLWELFKDWVRRIDPRSSASDKLSEFMRKYVYEAAENRRQPKITQFFINKPAQVNITKEQVVVRKKTRARPDYSCLTDEELGEEYQSCKILNDYSGKLLAKGEMNRRGLK